MFNNIVMNLIENLINTVNTINADNQFQIEYKSIFYSLVSEIHIAAAHILEKEIKKQTDEDFYVYNVGPGLNPKFYSFEPDHNNTNSNCFHRFIFDLNSQKWTLVYVDCGLSVQTIIEDVELDSVIHFYMIDQS